MKSMIGFPSEFADMTKLTEAYGRLEIDPKEFFKNYAKANMHNSMVRYSKIKDPIDYENPLWHVGSLFIATINAAYNRQANSIIVPAVSLGDRMFDSDRPMYTNYGAIGSIIGHEITHGFDNTGRLFDSEGNLGDDWWEPETMAELS